MDRAGTVRTNSQYTKPTQISLNGKNTGEYLFQNEIAPFLRSKGYKYSTGRINILCSPAVNEGPPVALCYGRRPLRTPEDVLAWADARHQAKIADIRGEKKNDVLRAASTTAAATTGIRRG